MKSTPIAKLFSSILCMAALPILNAEPPKPSAPEAPNRAAQNPGQAGAPGATADKNAEAKPAKSTSSDSPNRAAPDNPDKAASAMNDADVLVCLKGVNEHEIAAGNVAEKKKVNEAVTDYAKMMVKEHTKNLEMTSELMTKHNEKPLKAEKHAEKKAEHDKELAKLSEKDGDAFGKAYIDAMVKGHADVLDEIDTKLIPAAKNEDVKKHLAMTRKHVAAHLEAAQKIQASSK